MPYSRGMKLSTKKESNLLSSGSNSQKKFVIGDAAVIIDILRSRLYSHPLRTSIQEYISNARDANRESKSDQPIEITIPNRISPVFKVRDFGPGLSPERVEEVFVRYGVSTKRSDNTQTGGFGIGAKSAWAYTDSFTVVSYFEGIKYTYVAHLGSTTQGSMDLLDEESTDEANGVEISFGVKEEDIDKAVKAIYRVTNYWEVKPTLNGITNYEIPLTYKEFGLKFEEFIFAPQSPMWIDDSSASNVSVWAVIDGIPYALTGVIPESLRSKVFKGHILLKFKTGEIQINANREQIVFTPEILDLVKQKFESCLESIKDAVTTKMTNVQSLKALTRLGRADHALNTALTENFSINKTLNNRQITIRHEGRGNYFVILPDNDIIARAPFSSPNRGFSLSLEKTPVVITRPMFDDEITNLRNFFNNYQFGDKCKVSLTACAVIFTSEPTWYEELFAPESVRKDVGESLERFKELTQRRNRPVQTPVLKDPPLKLDNLPKPRSKVIGIQAVLCQTSSGYRVKTHDLTTLSKETIGWVYLACKNLPTTEYAINQLPGLIERVLYAHKVLKKVVILVDKNQATNLDKSIPSLESLWKEKTCAGYEKAIEALCYSSQCPSFLKELLKYQSILTPYWSDDVRPFFEGFLAHANYFANKEDREEIELLFSKEISEKNEEIRRILPKINSWFETNSFLRVLNYNLDLSEDLPVLLEKYNGRGTCG